MEVLIFVWESEIDGNPWSCVLCCLLILKENMFYMVSFRSAKTSYILWYLHDSFVLTKVVLFLYVDWCLFGLFGYLLKFENCLVWCGSSVHCTNVGQFSALSCCHAQLNFGSICLAWFGSVVLSCFVWFHMTIVGIVLTVL